MQDKQIQYIKPTERLQNNTKITLETTLLNSDDEVKLYNFSNTYNNIPRNMVIAIATELNTVNCDKYEIKNINSDYKIINKEKIIVTKITEVTHKQGTIIKIPNEISYEQRIKTQTPINKFKRVFTSDHLDLGCAHVEPCEIKFKTDKSTFQPP